MLMKKYLIMIRFGVIVTGWVVVFTTAWLLGLMLVPRTYGNRLWIFGILGLVIIYSTVTISLKSGSTTLPEIQKLTINEEETYVIFLSGLDSHCDGTPYNQMGFEYIRSQLSRAGLAYNDEHFLMFSYTGGKAEGGRWYPNAYNSADTGQPTQSAVTRLKDMVEEFSLHHPRARYILVGHSLGGRIAFDYAAKYQLVKPGPVKAVITLNSPLSGTSYYRVVNILAAFKDVWGSPVVKQLAAEYELRNEPGLSKQKAEAARGMAEAGIYLATFGTRQDIVVKPILACLTDEHGYPLTGGRIITANLTSDSFKDLGGHMQILNHEKVADYIIAVYSCP